jgi:hypothetical protein
MSGTAQAPVRRALNRPPASPGPTRAGWLASSVLSTVVAVLAGVASLLGLVVRNVYAGPAVVA